MRQGRGLNSSVIPLPFRVGFLCAGGKCFRCRWLSRRWVNLRGIPWGNSSRALRCRANVDTEMMECAALRSSCKRRNGLFFFNFPGFPPSVWVVSSTGAPCEHVHIGFETWVEWNHLRCCYVLDFQLKNIKATSFCLNLDSLKRIFEKGGCSTIRFFS